MVGVSETGLDAVPEGAAALPYNEALLAGYTDPFLPPVKVWPDAEYFMAEFSLAETGAIALSADPTIAALRLMLSTWHSTVRADDEHVMLGLETLVAAGILTLERRAQIVAMPL